MNQDPPIAETMPLESVAASPFTTFRFGPWTLRGILLDGEPWVVTADALAVLGLTHSALRKIPDRRKGWHSMPTLGGMQEIGILSEQGLYRLIFRSRKKDAEVMQDWIFDKVMPSLRKTGTYTHPGTALPAPKVTPRLRTADPAARKRVKRLEATLAAHEPAFVNLVNEHNALVAETEEIKARLLRVEKDTPPPPRDARYPDGTHGAIRAIADHIRSVYNSPRVANDHIVAISRYFTCTREDALAAIKCDYNLRG